MVVSVNMNQYLYLKTVMNHATIDNLDEIMDVFKQYKDISTY